MGYSIESSPCRYGSAQVELKFGSQLASSSTCNRWDEDDPIGIAEFTIKLRKLVVDRDTKLRHVKLELVRFQKSRVDVRGSVALSHSDPLMTLSGSVTKNRKPLDLDLDRFLC